MPEQVSGMQSAMANQLIEHANVAVTFMPIARAQPLGVVMRLSACYDAAYLS